MAYKRTNWQDHVVARPNTYTETTNSDGTITHTDASGEVIQQGTPMNATNFNNLEEALSHFAVAYDWMFCIMQANAREITTLKEQVATLSST